ncbi:MAG: hypothetical protein LJE65_01690 [Desulfobacteraceae bacterium]|nr:hypothetical protein [Desulfobacteraceae bacterium]
MKRLLDMTSGASLPVERIGGKALSLFRLQQNGFTVPETLVVITDVYDHFVDATGLRERILLELHRKDFDQMRWEEIWDASLRIRSLFLSASIPETLRREILDTTLERFGSTALVVRSSAPGEDAASASFAGLHETVVNVSGEEPLLDAVRKVWASLWSDASLLYRQELGLDPERSAMAVVIQPMTAGRCSGVVFTRNPADSREAVVEAVHGLNQGLVDGAVEPDRWILDRRSKTIVTYREPKRERISIPGPQGVSLADLSGDRVEQAPLEPNEVHAVFDMALAAESLFGGPQDVEWTWVEDRLTVLQCRPVTTATATATDQRGWYLSLHRSYENLVVLRKEIEENHIPAMEQAAREMGAVALNEISDDALADEIRRRRDVNDHWVQVYWSEFIPFAHGIRLFGQVYNDAVRPEDPFEFVELLSHAPLQSLDRNRRLEAMAERVRFDPNLRERLEQRKFPSEDHPFMQEITEFLKRFGDLSCSAGETVQCAQGPGALIHIVLEWAAQPEVSRPLAGSRNSQARIRRYLDAFGEERRQWAERLLELARASYRLRDDDNIFLGRIEARLAEAEQEALRRLAEGGASSEEEVRRRLKEVMDEKPDAGTGAGGRQEAGAERRSYRARQLVGQPAGPGLARGSARVVKRPEELLDMQRGEVLVVDAVDPNMTFVVPMASAIVERRGGMLIHGAIIAREYGLACVTGVPDATDLIRTGDEVTVDGYLGIVTLQ